VTTIYQDHATPVLALLAANTDLLAVYDGKVPDPTPAPPYGVVYFHFESLPGAAGNALDGVSAEVTTYVTCHCVGKTAAAARIVASQFRVALLDATPKVAGRTCGQIVVDSSQPPQPDETTGDLVMDQIDVYRFVSHPT
jgi:hypothetical protein